MALSSLAQRVATALVLVPLVLAALFLLPVRAFAWVALAIVLLASLEWSRLAGCAGLARIAFAGASLAVGAWLASNAWPVEARGGNTWVVLVCGGASAFWLVVAPAWLARGWPTRSPLLMSAVGLLVLVAFWMALVEFRTRSPWLVLAAMAVVWIADTAAYFAGRAFGRRKLAPSISPGKTWEGVYGGLAAVAIYAIALLAAAPRAGYGAESSIGAAALFVLLAVALAAVSVVGDLFESLMKRHAGVKDSGRLLPGHGGLLDRIDALLAAMPPAALAATLFLQPGGGA